MSASLSDQLTDILVKYEKDVENGFKKDLEDITKEALQKLKQKSPSDTGDYAKNWTKTKRKEAIILHNKKHRGEPSNITSLIEKGHAKRGGGRVKAIKHIEPVEQWANDELLKRTLERLKK